MGVCFFFGCNTNSRDEKSKRISQFEFPRNKKIAKIWYQRSKRDDVTFEQVMAKPKSYKVCAVHFEPHETNAIPWGNTIRNEILSTAIPRPAMKQMPASRTTTTSRSSSSSSSRAAASSTSSDSVSCASSLSTNSEQRNVSTIINNIIHVVKIFCCIYH